MAWIRLDDQIAHHPKFLKAGPIASWLWVCCIGYSQKFLTDGFVPTEALPTLSVVPDPHGLIQQLVKIRLLDTVENGYQIHDYLDFNESAAAVKQRRLQDRVRKDSGRNPAGIYADSGRNPAGIHADSGRNPAGVLARAPAIPSHPIPSHPIPVRTDRVKNTLSVNQPTKGNGKIPASPGPAKEKLVGPVKEFLTWFQIEYKTKRHGADYFVKWEKDAALVKQMLGATPPARLQQLAKILLSPRTDDPFIVESDRGIGILSTKFNWLSDRLAAWEAKHK